MTRRFPWPCVLASVLVLCMTAPTLAQRPPASKVEILSPAAGQLLTGLIDIRVKITPPEGGQMPASVRVGFGGPPWKPMKRVEGMNEWDRPA